MNVGINSSVGVNFKARQISKSYIAKTSPKQRVELFLLDNSDKEFGKKFVKNFDLKKLYPKEICYAGFKEWEAYIKNAFLKIGEYNVVLASQNNFPCGIMAFYEKNNQINLSYLAKWRTKPNFDVSYVGKILMHHLFDEAKIKNAINISLIPTQASPRGKNCREFYSQIGFRRSANNSMNLFGSDYAQKSKELEKFFEYQKMEKGIYVDSEKTFLININED